MSDLHPPSVLGDCHFDGIDDGFYSKISVSGFANPKSKIVRLRLTNVQNPKSDLFSQTADLTDLSDAQQEGVAGGRRRGGFDQFFFQTTEIDTFGEQQTQLSNGGNGLQLSSLVRTGYSFRQTTLSFLSSSFGRGGRNNPWMLMFSLFRNLFS